MDVRLPSKAPFLFPRILEPFLDWKSRVEFLSTYSTIKLLTHCLVYRPPPLSFGRFALLLRLTPGKTKISVWTSSPTMGLKELTRLIASKKTFKLAFTCWLFLTKHRGFGWKWRFGSDSSLGLRPGCPASEYHSILSGIRLRMPAYF